MRIGIDTTPLPPNPVGAGKYIIELTRALIELNASLPVPHELVLFAQPVSHDLITHQEQRFIDAPGLTWVLVQQKNPPLRLAWEQTMLPLLVHRYRLRLLHSLHYTRPLYLPCRSVVTFHDMTFLLYPQLHTLPKRIIFPPAIRASARLADALIAVSEHTRQDAIRLLHIPPKKIHTAPHGVLPSYHPITDPSVLQSCQEKYHLPSKFILYVGAIEPRKNLPTLIRSYAALNRADNARAVVGAQHVGTHCAPTIPHLVLVGRLGWMYAEVLELIEQTGLQEKIHLTGYVPEQDLPAIYNLAQVFVYPSTYEGFGLPPLEAMACGTPVITTHVSAMIDVVGQAGILVAPNDEPALRQALQDMLTSPQLREDLRARGLTQAAGFTWQKTAHQTIQVYDSLS